MNSINSTIDIKKLFTDILETGISKDIIDKIEQLNCENISEENQLVIYNMITLAELKILNMPSLLTKLTLLKLKLLDTYINQLENTKDDNIDTKNTCEKEIIKQANSEIESNILMQNKFGKINKYYLPNTEDSSFTLPKQGEYGTIHIRQFNDDNKLFIASVQVDYTGKVVRIIDEPELEDTTPIDFDTLYTDLAAEVLQYKVED